MQLYGLKQKNQKKNLNKQVKKYFVPFASKLHEERRERIGVEKLSYVDNDVFFTNGNPAPTGTPEEILAAGQKMYSELSPQTKEFFDFMRENELFDVLGRKTKRQGGYMTYIPNFKSPFISISFYFSIIPRNFFHLISFIYLIILIIYLIHLFFEFLCKE